MSKLQQVPIGDLVGKVRTWNPCAEGPEDEFTYIDISSIDRDAKQIVETNYILGSDAPSRARQLVAVDDLLVSTVRPNLNAIAQVPNNLNGATASTGFCVLRPNQTKLNSRYLYHWLRTPVFVNTMVLLSTGANYPAVTDSIVKSSTIPLPPLAEQQRIVAILDQADALRVKRRAALARLDRLVQSVFLEMFGDPANSPYRVMTMHEVCELITDGSHVTPTYTSDGVPFLRVTDIQSDKIDWGNTKKISAEEHQLFCKRMKPQMGDVLYSKNGTIGIPKLVDWEEEFSIFVSLALLRPKSSIIVGGYLESFLSTPYALRQAISHTKTGTVSNLHLVEIKKVKLPVPPMDIQTKWLNFKEKIKIRKHTLISSANSFDNLFASIQQRAFRGEL